MNLLKFIRQWVVVWVLSQMLFKTLIKEDQNLFLQIQETSQLLLAVTEIIIVKVIGLNNLSKIAVPAEQDNQKEDLQLLE